MLVEYVSVTRVWPRTSKGITDLLLSFFLLIVSQTKRVPLRSLLQMPKYMDKQVYPILLDPPKLNSRKRSCSLSELTRQFKPPTKNGHAPPFILSWKSYQSVNPFYVLSWWVFPRWVKLSRRFHAWWCSSVNSFKFRSCDYTTPRVRIF